MPGTTLQTILSTTNLSGVIQKVKPGLPVSCMPPALVNPTGAMLRNVSGGFATFRTERGTRKVARRASPGSPSRNRSISAVGEQQINLIAPRENFQIPAVSLQNLESNEGQRQRMGESEVARQLAESKQLLENSRAAAAFSALALGTINYDTNGNLLGSTSGALVSVDMLVPANNKNQCNGIISTSWSNPAASIIQQIQNLQKTALQLTGHRLAHAMYGTSVVANILQNVELAGLIRANPAYQTAFANTMIPDGFLGIAKWWPAYESFWESDTGSAVEPFGANQVTFCPEPSEAWYELTVGSTPVPRDINVSSDMAAAVANLIDVGGYYTYAYLTPDPVMATCVYGDAFLPFIKVPEAVFQAVTVF